MQGDALLPELRQELELIEAGASEAGSPGWLVHDPVRSQYFEIDWISHALLRDWEAITVSALLHKVRARGQVQVGEADVMHLLDFLRQHQLVQPPADASKGLAAKRQQLQGNWWNWLLHNYLFFRVPLVRPNGILNRTHTAIGFIFTRRFAWLTLCAGVLGLLGVIRQWDVFAHTLVDFYSWQGLFAYGLTLAFVKVLHELGHAYTAIRMGCKVPTMGLAFMVLWPVLYTDTNDVWRLKEHRQRLAVSSAGVLTELGVALWATFFWVLMPEGALRNMLFLLSTTTWVSTVLINASPFMRFDGYFILMDVMRFNNLHGRAFAMARWHLRKGVLGLQDPAPEPLAPRQQTLLVLFGWATWLYRLILFLGIAALVYHFFIKVVGIILFLVELIWFIAKPIASELRVWRERWTHAPVVRRILLTTGLSALLLLPSLLPLPGRITASAVVMPQQVQPLYAPKNAMVSAIGTPEISGKDAPLFAFDAPQLNAQNTASLARQASAQWQSGVVTMNPELRGQWQALTAQSELAQAEGQWIRSNLSTYQLAAAFGGRLHVLDPELQPGQWTLSGEKLGYLVGAGGLRAIAYVPGVDLHRLHKGQRALFMPDSGVGPALELVVERIHTDRARTLTEPELALSFGGSVPVREQRGLLFPEGAYYRVELVPLREEDSQAFLSFKWRGQVSIDAASQPLLTPWLKAAMSVLIRETGF